MTPELRKLARSPGLRARLAAGAACCITCLDLVEDGGDGLLYDPSPHARKVYSLAFGAAWVKINTSGKGWGVHRCCGRPAFKPYVPPESFGWRCGDCQRVVVGRGECPACGAARRPWQRGGKGGAP